MGNANALDEAAQRLAAALKNFETRVADLRHDQLTSEQLEEQLQSLNELLSAEKARYEKLEAVNEEVTERLDSAMKTIRDILKSD